MNMTRFLRLAFWLVILGSLTVAVRGSAQGSPTVDDKWVGVWQGALQGVPDVVLTLSDDFESPSGTIVFTIFGTEGTKEHSNVVGHQVRAIMHSEVNGDSLFFQVKGLGNPSSLMEMTFTLAGMSKGQLKCLKCGSAAPIELRLLR